MRLRFALSLALLVTASTAALAGPWQDYPIIEWQTRTPQQLAAMQRIGITAGNIIANREHPEQPRRKELADLRSAGMGFYLENIATDFYAAYHRWVPGKPVNWQFVDAQQRYRADPSDRKLLFREPSLSDPVWLGRIRKRLMTTVRLYRPEHPLYYDLADESGIADLTSFWDFDLSPESVAGMQHWLRQQYGSLAALNAEWGSQFQSWSAVQPETTRQAMQRRDGNFAAWSDFKAWMDLSYARALRAGTDAVHAADPQAIAGMEGVQVAGWGGFNYADLAHAVDLMEVSGFEDESLPLLQSLNPRLIPLITSSSSDPGSLRRIWYATLNGARGLVLWDGSDSIIRPDGTPGPDAKAYAPAFAALHRVVPLLSGSTPVWDSVAILYSPESFRLQWMLDQQPNGDAWMSRKSETELEVNAWRRALRGYLESLRSLHLRPRLVTAPMLQGLQARVLILPDTLSLSSSAAHAIAQFSSQGGLVIADRPPGEFDGHGKRLAQPALPPRIAHLVEQSDWAAISRLLAQAGVTPRVAVDNPDGSSAFDVWLYLYRRGDELVLALERRDGGAEPRKVVVALPQGTTIARGLLGGKAERAGDRISVELPPVEPTILLLSAGRQ